MFHVAPASPDDSSAQQTLVGARADAERIRAEAEREAARIIRDAEERADLLLKARLAYAERELDRLRSLRRNIGTLLESSVSALRVVEHLLPNDGPRGAEEPRSAVQGLRRLGAFADRYRDAIVVSICLVVGGSLAAAAWYASLPRRAQPRAETTPSAGAVVAKGPTLRALPDARVAPPAPVPPLAPAATTGDSPASASVAAAAAEAPPLTVMLAAERQCWIRATIDGTRVIERLLEADEELVVTAREGVLLRVGDAGALSATINGKAALRFGGPGQVITTRITLQNYARWLAGLS